MIPFGEWLPDQPDLENPGATEAKNVVPSTAKSYGPLSTLGSVTDALDARCQGAFSARRDSDGGTYLFAGDAAKLYLAPAQAFSDVSQAAVTYDCPATENWEFTQYGDRVIAVNINDAPQSYVLASSTEFADLGGSPPKARHVNTIRDWVFLGNLDISGTRYPSSVQWSAIDNPADWPTIGSADAASKQSDLQTFPSGGWVQKIIGGVGGVDGAIFQEYAIRRVVYEGPPTVFGFYEVERARGTPAPNSVVNADGDVAFYLGEDGFYAFNGLESAAIGSQKVDRWFFADLNQSYFERIVGAADPIGKRVWWIYPSSNSSDGTPDSAIVFNWDIGRWSYARFDSQWLFSALSAGYTLEGLDALGYTLDTLPLSLDARAWTGGRLLLSAFTTDHKQALFTGTALEATLETGEFGGPGLSFLSGVRPYVDGGSPTVTARHRATPQASLTDVGPNSVDADGMAHFTISDRYFRAQVIVPAGSSWTHAQGIDADIEDEGAV
jgi:hypothetical protein